MRADRSPRQLDGQLHQAPTSTADSAACGRAEAAFRHEYDKWELLIEAVLHDRSLSPDRRLAALASLRWRQREAAEGARRRVLEEEMQIAEAARRKVKRLNARAHARRNAP